MNFSHFVAMYTSVQLHCCEVSAVVKEFLDTWGNITYSVTFRRLEIENYFIIYTYLTPPYTKYMRIETSVAEHILFGGGSYFILC